MKQEDVEKVYKYLHDNYSYREDGILIHRKTNQPWVGYESRNGKSLLYEVSIRLNNKKLNMSYSHAIYIYHHKEKPKYIAHVDGNPVNNQIENLKIETMTRRILLNDTTTKNKHRYKGVVKDGNKYYARLMINKKFKWISSHNTPEEAHQSYLKAKKEFISQ